MKGILDKIRNSYLWWHLYEKHTRRAKREIQRVKDGVMKTKRRILGRDNES